EHALGTFGASLDYVRALYADRTDPFFRLQTTHLDIRALLLLALLHDVGHIAFGHYLEEVPPLDAEWRHESYLQLVLSGCQARASVRMEQPKAKDGVLRAAAEDSIPSALAGTRRAKDAVEDACVLHELLLRDWVAGPDASASPELEVGAL